MLEMLFNYLFRYVMPQPLCNASTFMVETIYYFVSHIGILQFHNWEKTTYIFYFPNSFFNFAHDSHLLNVQVKWHWSQVMILFRVLQTERWLLLIWIVLAAVLIVYLLASLRAKWVIFLFSNSCKRKAQYFVSFASMLLWHILIELFVVSGILKELLTFDLLDSILLIWLVLRGNWFIDVCVHVYVPVMSPWFESIVCLFTYILLDIRQKSSGAEGERLKEATNINKSLSTLGLVSSLTMKGYCWFFQCGVLLKN